MLINTMIVAQSYSFGGKEQAEPDHRCRLHMYLSKQMRLEMILERNHI